MPLPCVVDGWQLDSKNEKFPSLSPGQGNLVNQDVDTVSVQKFNLHEFIFSKLHKIKKLYSKLRYPNVGQIFLNCWIGDNTLLFTFDQNIKKWIWFLVSSTQNFIRSIACTKWNAMQ